MEKITRGKHPASLKNIEKHKFKPGNKMGGRKPGSISLTDSLRRAVEMEFTGGNLTNGKIETRQVRDWIGIALAGKAMAGDVAAIREMLDRLDGKTTDKVEVTGKDGKPLAVEHDTGLQRIYDRAAKNFGSRRTETIDKKPIKD